MRVPTNSLPTNLMLQLQKLTEKQTVLNRQVTTGQKIVDPADNPSAFSRTLNLQREKSTMQQYQENAGKALDITKVSYSAMKQLKDLNDRAVELGLLAGGATNPADYRMYAAEINQLIEQTLQGGNAKYRGDYLLGGTKTDIPPFVAVRDASGEITSVTYQGTSTYDPTPPLPPDYTPPPEFYISEGTKVSPYVDVEVNQEIVNFVDDLVQLRDDMRNGNTAFVRTSLQALLDAEEERFLVPLSDLGALQARVEVEMKQNSARFTELENLVSREVDADLAETMVELSQTQTSYQAALQSGVRILNLSLLDYI